MNETRRVREKINNQIRQFAPSIAPNNRSGIARCYRIVTSF